MIYILNVSKFLKISFFCYILTSDPCKRILNLFLDFLQTLKKLPDLICVTETKLKSLPLRNLSIPNYEFYFSNSPTNAGGVAIYISKHFIVHNASKQLIGITGCEDLWLKFGDRTNHSQYLVGSIYRHPLSANFKEAFNDLLSQLLTSNIKLFVLGDLNIDISDTNRTSTATNYLNMIQSYGLLPLITKPTRVTETTSTILDHILTNDVHHCILPEIIQYDLSDHYPVFCTVFDPSSEKCGKFGMKQMVRDLTNFLQDNFISDLEDFSFEFNSTLATKEINYHSFNEIFQIFIQIIKNVINKYCPIKLISRKKQRLN